MPLRVPDPCGLQGWVFAFAPRPALSIVVGSLLIVIPEPIRAKRGWVRDLLLLSRSAVWRHPAQRASAQRLPLAVPLPEALLLQPPLSPVPFLPPGCNLSIFLCTGSYLPIRARIGGFFPTRRVWSPGLVQVHAKHRIDNFFPVPLDRALCALGARPPLSTSRAPIRLDECGIVSSFPS